jgi:glycerophosphoryl diester phosphodiesterase
VRSPTTPAVPAGTTPPGPILFMTELPARQTRVDMDQSNGFGRQVAAELDGTLLSSGSDGDRVRVLAHRGSAAPGRPENSAAAVTEALLQGADGVEIDVRLTAEGTLVCSHDPIDRLTAAGLASIATLAEVLAAAQAFSGTRVVVEAKPVAGAELALRTADALAEVLRTAAGSAVITVSSFDPVLLAAIRAACADLPVRTALLGDKTDSVEDVVRRAAEGGHDEVHLPLTGVRRAPEVVELAHSLGLAVALWTVNRRPALQWVAELGADAVITDDVLTAWSELDRTVLPELIAA